MNKQAAGDANAANLKRSGSIRDKNGANLKPSFQSRKSVSASNVLSNGQLGKENGASKQVDSKSRPNPVKKTEPPTKTQPKTVTGLPNKFKPRSATVSTVNNVELSKNEKADDKKRKANLSGNSLKSFDFKKRTTNKVGPVTKSTPIVTCRHAFTPSHVSSTPCSISKPLDWTGLSAIDSGITNKSANRSGNTNSRLDESKNARVKQAFIDDQLAKAR